MDNILRKTFSLITADKNYYSYRSAAKGLPESEVIKRINSRDDVYNTPQWEDVQIRGVPRDWRHKASNGVVGSTVAECGQGREQRPCQQSTEGKLGDNCHIRSYNFLPSYTVTKIPSRL